MSLQIRGSAGWIAIGIHARTKTDQAENQRARSAGATGHTGDRSDAAHRNGSSVVLLLPRPVAAGGVPHVPGGSGKSAEAADRMHARADRSHDRSNGPPASAAGPQAHPGI